jgi:hypothetical protein
MLQRSVDYYLLITQIFVATKPSMGEGESSFIHGIITISFSSIKLFF